MARNNPVNPPLYQNACNQQCYNPAAYTDGSDNYDGNNLLPQQGSSNDSVPAPRQKKGSNTLTITFGIFLLAAIVTFHFYPQQAHDRIRREREAEERDHQVMRDAWNSERQAIVVERGTWQKERADHILERESMAAEREQWRRERTDHENRQHQEEEEKRALIVWQDLKASTQCLRYGTREYSATLAQVPLGMDPLKECWKKSIDIHGRQLFPSRCDTQGMCGTVTGHWIIDFDEPSCVTWWRGYDNKGCVERGIHRYESVLENVQWGDDWHVMCASTPGRVQGRNFDRPSSCASWLGGINAIWLVEDGDCQ